LYPNAERKKFDIEYYCTKHAKFVTDLLGDALQGASIESGLSGDTPDSPAPFAAIATMYFNSLESFQQSFGPNADKIMADLPNFTDIEPMVQISEVML
ncbi:MAG: EthD family reductase, partial [bacterium]